ncbi:hypothetical protein HID58_086664 [Brassica napus]|uniref:Uncharacterized protein n=1 Tax=Brassica napus TaxID=3708 RepID=A0ABQ7XTQ4_BRANA|nr:hypothetical protein HID58_086664 [Brassica napus]
MKNEQHQNEHMQRQRQTQKAAATKRTALLLNIGKSEAANEQSRKAPTSRSKAPSEADPERRRSWRRLERQRDLGDLLSTIQSSFGGKEAMKREVCRWMMVVGLQCSSSSACLDQSLVAQGWLGDTRTSSGDEENNQSSEEQEPGTQRRGIRRRRAFIDDEDES